jgi:hypothetical protein
LLLVGGRVAAVLPWLRTSQPSIFRLGILPRPIGAGRDGVSPGLELINITICRLVGRVFAVGEWLQLATPIKVLPRSIGVVVQRSSEWRCSDSKLGLGFQCSPVGVVVEVVESPCSGPFLAVAARSNNSSTESRGGRTQTSNFVAADMGTPVSRIGRKGELMSHLGEEHLAIVMEGG